MVVGKRRERIAFGFDAFHQAIAAVLGAAAQLRDRAALRHAEAMVEMWLRQDGLDAARSDPGLHGVLGNPRLQDVLPGWRPTGTQRSTTGARPLPAGCRAPTGSLR